MTSSVEMELEAMQKIVRLLEPFAPAMRARILMSAALLMAPHALDDAAVLRAFRQARQDDANG